MIHNPRLVCFMLVCASVWNYILHCQKARIQGDCQTKVKHVNCVKMFMFVVAGRFSVECAASQNLTQNSL